MGLDWKGPVAVGSPHYDDHEDNQISIGQSLWTHHAVSWREGGESFHRRIWKKLPFFCYLCGITRHTHLECPTPARRNALGKLPYELKLRASDERKKKLQSFGAAAAESFGNSTGSGRSSATQQSSNNTRSGASGEEKGKEKIDEEEITSPLKQKGKVGVRKGAKPKQLFVVSKQVEVLGQRKRNHPGENPTPDLNIPAVEPIIVPSGLVSDRSAQLGNASG